MRALVTGASGFIGSHLVNSLLDRKVEVIALARRELTTPRDGLIWVYADLADIPSLKRTLNQLPPCENVFHFGAQMPDSSKVKDISFYLPANVEATAILVEKAASWSARSFVYASSMGVIGEPVENPVTEDHVLAPPTSYHLTKAIAETVCDFANRMGIQNTVSLRITSPYGHGMNTSSVISRFLELARLNQPLTLFGSGSRTQNFVYVQDVVSVAIAAVERCATGVFNVGGQDDVSMRDLADIVIQSVPGCQSVVVYCVKEDPQENFRWSIDIGKARRVLGYEPRHDLKAGLKAMLKMRGVIA